MKAFIVKHHWIAAALLCASLLTGCVTDGEDTGLKSSCTVLDGPYSYGTKDVNGPVHAGPKLAPRLARHNSIGHKLNCPGF